MNEYENHGTSIVLWHHEPNHVKFTGRIWSDPIKFSFEISPDSQIESDAYYVNIYVSKFINHDVTKEIPFDVKTVSNFVIRLKPTEIPSLNLMFEMIKESNKQFSLIYEEKTQNTVVSIEKIPVPVLGDLKDQIGKYLYNWDNKLRKS